MSDLGFSIVNDPKIWDEFVFKHPGGSFFHTADWLQVLEAGFGVETERLGLFTKDGALVGIIPILNKKMSLFKLTGSPLGGYTTPYQGPLIQKGLRLQECIALLIKYLKSQGKDYFEVFVFDNSNKDQYLANRFMVEEMKTLVLDVSQSKEILWDNLEVRCRNAVRKGEKSGLEIRWCQEIDEWLEPYYQMSVEIYSRQGMDTPYSKEFFRALWEKFYPKGQLKVLMVIHEGKGIAGGIFPVFKDCCYYLDGVSDRAYSKLVPNNLLQWKYIAWAAEQTEIKHYDMVGANIPSIAKFKESFGSVLQTTGYYHRSLTLRSKVGRAVYKKYGKTIKKFLG